MNLVGKKNPKKPNSPTQKHIHRRKFKKTTKGTIHRSLPMCLCAKFYNKGTVYSSVKANALTSGQEVDNHWA